MQERERERGKERERETERQRETEKGEGVHECLLASVDGHEETYLIFHQLNKRETESKTSIHQ